MVFEEVFLSDRTALSMSLQVFFLMVFDHLVSLVSCYFSIYLLLLLFVLLLWCTEFNCMLHSNQPTLLLLLVMNIM